MKRSIFFLFALLSCSLTSFAYSGSFYAPSGQILYYNLVSGGIQIVPPTTSSSNPWGSYEKPTGNLVIPDSINITGGYPYPITSIGNYAFRDCTGLTSVTIPNSVTSIGNSAFYGCTGLTSMTIPNSVDSIIGHAFGNCTGLTSVVFNADSCMYAGAIYSSYTNIVFDDCTNITSFTFGNNVKVIPACLCYGLTGLTSVTIPNSVTSIGNYAFRGCHGLTSVTIGNSVTSIGGYAFEYCYGLTTITIPNSVTNIGACAFYQCTGLASVTIPNSVTIIGVWAFRQCTGLTSVTIGNSVTSIGGYAFEHCTGLTSVTIGNSVTSIGLSAFSQCTGLSIIKFLSSTPPTIASGFSSAFAGIPSNYMVRVPCGCISQYSTIISSSHLRQVYYELYAMSDDDSTGAVQILTGPSCSNHNAVLSAVPADGHRFGHWSTGSTDNPYTLTVTSDTTITAFFEELETYSLTLLADNPAMGNVTGGGVYDDGSSVTITAYPADGYRFDHWSTGSTDNPYTLTVTSDTTITAFFVETHTVNVLVDNPATGSVTGGGVYDDGSSVTITAYPADGYRFDHWSTGSTDNPYTLTVTSDTTIIAYFVSNGTQGIGEVGENDIHISVFNGRISVEGITNEEVRVYDITGRTVQNRSLPSGVYIVKVGTLPAQKVVVMR